MLKRMFAILLSLSVFSASLVAVEAATEYLSVVDYGAVGDGIADDTAALQAAFDAGAENDLPVYIPAGIYNYSKLLYIDSITVFGQGPEESILRATRYDYEAVQLSVTSPRVYSIQIEGKGGEEHRRNIDKSGDAFFVNGATDFEIANCYANNPSAIGIQVENTKNGKILYNKVNSTGADGMLISSSSGIEVAYNHTYRCGDDAIAVTTFGSNTCSDMSIHDNRCEENLYCRNIALNGVIGAEVYNNYISEGNAGISITATTDWNTCQNQNVKVYNNIFKNINAYVTNNYGAIHLRNDRGGTDTNIEIYNNLIYDYHRYGICLTGKDPIEANVHDNRFYADNGMGLFINEGGIEGVVQTNNTLNTAEAYPGDLFFSKAGFYDGYVKGLGLPRVENSKIYKLGRLQVKNYENNKIGPWGFYATAGFYPPKPIVKGSGYNTGNGYLTNSGINYDAYKYGVVTDNKYYIPMAPRWIANYNTQEPADSIYDYLVRGVYFSTDGLGYPYGNRPQILIPEKKDNGGFVKFWCDAPEKTNKAIAGDVAVSFTAPDDGNYDIYSYFENRGMRGITVNGECMHRISILQNGAIKETSQNTTDTLFGAFKNGVAPEPLEQTKSVYLKRGDMVFVRISAYNDGYNDQVYGKVIITQKDEVGEALAIYDLSDVGMSDTGDFKFYYANPDVTDTKSYTRLHMTSDGPLAAHTGRPPWTEGEMDDLYLSPAIRWDAKESERVTMKNDSRDCIISWTAPENGRYKVSVDAQRSDNALAQGGEIAVSVVENGTNENSTKWFSVAATATTPTENSGETWLNQGDTIFFRAHSDAVNARLRLESGITIENTSNLLTARYFIGDTQIENINGFTAGSQVTAKIDVKNTTKLPINAYAIVGIYDAQGRLLDYGKSSKFTVLSYRTKSTTAKFTVPQHSGNVTVKAFLWNDLNTLKPVTLAEVLAD